MKWFKNILFGIILLGLCLPLVQQEFDLVELEPLSGVHHEPDTLRLNRDNWMAGKYQDKFSSYYEFVIGFRPFFIRLHNQLYYWLYKGSTTYVVVGKDNQLFSWDYWNTYRGYNYVGEDSMQVKIQNLALLRDSLRKMGKPLLCVIAPNKVRYMPEKLPKGYATEPGEVSNYSKVKELMANYNIPVLDLNGRFVAMKDTVKYPLFANTSTHWSGYGMNLGMKWMIDSLEGMAQKNFVNLRFRDWELHDSALNSDRDMVDLMNLLFPIETEPLAFPEFAINPSAPAEPDEAKPVKALIIGDSFFWNYYAFEERHEIFHEDTRFWYYNNTERDLKGNERPVEGLSARQAVAEADVVVILATEANLHLFPYGFPDKFLGEN